MTPHVFSIKFEFLNVQITVFLGLTSKSLLSKERLSKVKLFYNRYLFCYNITQFYLLKNIYKKLIQKSPLLVDQDS